MKAFFTLVLLFCGTTLFAQDFQQAKVLFADGKELTGLVKASSVGEKGIVYRAAEAGSKNEKISSSELTRIIFTQEGAEPTEYVPMRLAYNDKMSKNAYWLRILSKGPVTLYALNGGFGFQRSGFDHQVSDINFYVKRPNEEAASSVGVYFTSGAQGINLNRNFRKLAGRYFADYPELAAKIENKEFGVLDVLAVVTAYNEWKGAKN